MTAAINFAAVSDTESATAANGAPSTRPEELTQFLSLLTAQVQNQDPLEPLDSTQFVEQLATFSSLEQQVRSNGLLEDILAALNGTADG